MIKMKRCFFVFLFLFPVLVFSQQEEQQIKTILDKMYNVDKVASKVFDFPTVFKLLEGQKLTNVSSDNNMIYQLLSTKYGFDGSRDIRDAYHAFSADDIKKDKLVQFAGCTGAARVFYDYALKDSVLKNKVRYVVSSRKSDYLSACPACGKQRDDKVTINGHQVVAVKIDGKWKLLNTSSPVIEYATYFKVPQDVVEKKFLNGLMLQEIKYGNMPGAPYIVTAILEKDDVTSHKALMNYSVSGDKNDGTCSWNKKLK